MVQNDMDKAEEYVMEYLSWYDKRSIQNKKAYNILAVSSICLTLLIPFLTELVDKFFRTQTYIISFFSSIAAVSIACQAHFRCHDKWIEYRYTAEKLRYELILYEINLSPYNNPEKAEILIKRARLIIGNENNIWREKEYSKKETQQYEQNK